MGTTRRTPKRGNKRTGHRGQFASTKTKTSANEAATRAGTCKTCGVATKRRSGLCRKHDPAKQKQNNTDMYDRTQPSVTSDQIVRCGGQVAAGDTLRQCKNAVRIDPGLGQTEPLCHQHGGNTTNSLARTFAKAKAEADRGECYPLQEEFWQQPEIRLEAAQGMILNMLASDTSQFVEDYYQMAMAQRLHGTARFSARNQADLWIQHIDDIIKEQELDYETFRENKDLNQQVFMEASERLAEPHFTKSKWEELGRRPVKDPVYVIQARRWKQRKDDSNNETDDDNDEPETIVRTTFKPLAEYPLSATEGDPYGAGPDVPKETKHYTTGDMEAARSHLDRIAQTHDIPVEFVKARPSSGASGYWDGKKIVVWEGVGGGDPGAQFRTYSHELGHALMKHGSDQSVEQRRPDMEVAAETFAYLMCQHHGVQTDERSAHYIQSWNQEASVDMTQGTTTSFVSAIKTFQQILDEDN